jgi:multidrug efflux pump subunit AcrA (membrane-fusion protein)
VTSWGVNFEIFAEVDMLAAGETATSHTHVTVLEDFSPLSEGRVSAILTSASGAESVFTQETILRPGIFSIDITPPADGEYGLTFRIETAGISEVIPSGRVYVGITSEPGMLIEAPPPPYGPASETAAGSPPVGFLKEQQWKTSFATAWTSGGVLHTTVDGFAKTRPAAGSDVIVSAPTNGILADATMLYAGMPVREGAELMKLLPRAVSEQSLSELRSELEFERLRLSRLEKLVAIGGATEEQRDEARARVAALVPLVEGDGDSGALAITAPITGRIAEVWVRPGVSAEAGDSLLRIVRTNAAWIDVALDAQEIAALGEDPRSLHLRIPGAAQALSFAPDEFRLVATSPALDPITGNASALFELTSAIATLPLGATIEASIGVARQDSGIVIDASALVDDGGTDVVYAQIEGESFARLEVHVLRREGDRVLVAGLEPGVRVATRGGAMVRRASMLSTGGIEGHVH